VGADGTCIYLGNQATTYFLVHCYADWGEAPTGASSWYWGPRYGQFVLMCVFIGQRGQAHVWPPLYLVGPRGVRLWTTPFTRRAGEAVRSQNYFLSPHKHEERV
jgi:hypothetical protein